ncbi:MAG: hypothetical protein CL672_01540 [Balneola sp.]|nr:hypothetical protein [Balneola sp.]
MKDRSGLLKRLEIKEYPQPTVWSLRYPVLLCHGFGAIGSLVKPSPLHDPCMCMRIHGLLAFAPNIVPYAPIEVRARSWVRIINYLSHRHSISKFNVIAHSMGGLDMRYALAHLGIEEKIASLTTIATPHKGTYLADFVRFTPEILSERIGDIVDWFADNVYIKECNDAFGSVDQLTRRYVQEHFNPNTPDPADIPIFSYSAAVGKGTNDSLNPIFLFQNNLIHEKEGSNDSFVSVESAQWGEHLGTIRLSHLNLINVQVGSREAKKRYLEFWTGIIQHLKSREF